MEKREIKKERGNHIKTIRKKRCVLYKNIMECDGNNGGIQGKYKSKME
jgi:hypothetical protein